MGTVTSKEEKTVDGGYPYTIGLYANVTPDYDKKVVRKLITSRKLAPFYKGLDEVDAVSGKTPTTSSTPKNNNSLLYADAVECPICFLYYPSNINYSKCCDQPICTECVVQLKRTDPAIPTCCPFCVQPNFGILYHLPSSVTHSDRYAAMFSTTPSCHHVLTKNVITRSTSGQDIPPNSSLQQTNSQTRRSLAKQKPSMIVLVDHLRPGCDTQPTSINTMESSLPLRRYYATDMTMETPSFEEWMVMEAVRRSLQDQQQQHMSTRHDTNQRTTTIASDDSSILC
ncbi:hypothetical protein BC941DRAFT_409646 [Chlamydoabsidia padenii]|nr:hypothetical protein BC941DRAFT_409646 [Chlamydoabsidia padenii]